MLSSTFNSSMITLQGGVRLKAQGGEGEGEV